ncbi:hypothetical protein Tco_0390390 [Tanacetum coccineum]
MSPGNVAREGIPFELFRSTYPGRHVARERYPQRQVARDTPDLSLEYSKWKGCGSDNKGGGGGGKEDGEEDYGGCDGYDDGGGGCR